MRGAALTAHRLLAPVRTRFLHPLFVPQHMPELPCLRTGAARLRSCSAQSAWRCSSPSSPACFAPRTASRYVVSSHAWPVPAAVGSLLCALAVPPVPAVLHNGLLRSCSPARQAVCLRVQQAWPEHKRAHKPGPESWLFCTQRGRARSTTMPDFRWTGSLRPTPIAPRRPVCACSCVPEQRCLGMQLV